MEYKISFERPIHLKLIGQQSYKKGWKRDSAPKGNVCFLMLDGAFSFTVGEKTVTAEKNDLVFFKSNTKYKVFAERDCKYFYAHFSADAEPANEESTDEKHSICFPEKISLSEFPEKRERLIWLLSLCERISCEKPIYTDLRLDNIFCEFLILSASLHAEKRKKSIPLSIKKIEKFIKENTSSPITLTDISEKFMLSKQYIMRSFKRYYGISVTHMINSEKLNRALILLKDTDMTIEEISDSLSFSSSGYFCRVFKRYFSLTPTEYRRQSAW